MHRTNLKGVNFGSNASNINANHASLGTQCLSLSLNSVCSENIHDAYFNLDFATSEYCDPLKSHDDPLSFK